MPIDEKQLHPIFRPATVQEKREKERLRAWKGVFYTLRQLCWREACRNLRKEGLANGTLVYDSSGEVVTEDGQPITAVFNEHRGIFEESFDRAFAHATVQEMADYAKEHFGLSYNDLMQINSDRMAQFRNRESTKYIGEQPF